MTIRSMQEARDALQQYVPLVAQQLGKDTTLDRIVPLMRFLGNPQDKLRVIHIAGTSGKTSTAYYIAALLKEAGCKVGLTVSPHIDSITERVQINGLPIGESVFFSQLGVFLDSIGELADKPSYFEVLYSFSIWVFAAQQVDYAVIETGLGGLYDSTNVANREDKICVITDIGFDHMHILGNTLGKIAAQKIGIVHKHNVTFMYGQDPEIMAVVRSWVDSHEAQLTVLEQTTEASAAEQSSMTMPDFQKRNWLLARHVQGYVTERDGLKELSKESLRATQCLQVPARMDAVQVDQKTIVMDGAHNFQKIMAFIDSFKRKYPHVKPALLVSFKTGKDFEPVIPILSELASRIIITTFGGTQDMPLHSMDPDILGKAFKNSSDELLVDVIVDQHEAYQALLNSSGEIKVITGSFYLIAQIRNNEHIA